HENIKVVRIEPQPLAKLLQRHTSPKSMRPMVCVELVARAARQFFHIAPAREPLSLVPRTDGCYCPLVHQRSDRRLETLSLHRALRRERRASDQRPPRDDRRDTLSRL